MKLVSLKSTVAARCTHYVSSSRTILFMMAGFCCTSNIAAKVYINYHMNSGVGGTYDALFTPSNEADDHDGDDDNKLEASGKEHIQEREFWSGIQALKDIVETAARDGKRLRPYGSKWSVTEIPYTDEYMIETHQLNYAKVGIENDAFVTDDYKGDRKSFLTFTQCGVRLKFLYLLLFRHGLTLSTSTSTDGQTMAGCISTGCHNAAIRFGAMQDYVKGIHIVLLGKTVFLQRDSDPVVTNSYMTEIGADELISDDDMFNAALVSFGTFGVVHGYLIETEKLFRLESEVKRFPFSEAIAALSSLDIASLGFELDDPSELPWHFEAFVNPYGLDNKIGTSVRVMQKIPLSNEEIDKIKKTASLFDPSYSGQSLMLVLGGEFFDALGLQESPEAFGTIAEVKREFYSSLNDATILSYLLFGGVDSREGFPCELYGDPLATATDQFYIPISTTTFEPCVPLADLNTTLHVINDILYTSPAPTVLHIRYLKQSNATLAQSSFDGINVCIALNSVDGMEAKVAYQKVAVALAARQRRRTSGAKEQTDDDANKFKKDDEDDEELISFRYHWGKVLPKNEDWIRQSHGPALDDWLQQRSKLLTRKEMYIFSNDYTDTLGLTTGFAAKTEDAEETQAELQG